MQIEYETIKKHETNCTICTVIMCAIKYVLAKNTKAYLIGVSFSNSIWMALPPKWADRFMMIERQKKTIPKIMHSYKMSS